MTIFGIEISWEAITACATIIAALGAAGGAIFAGCQLYSDRRWRKLDRTYSHSPYRNEKLLEAIKELESICSEFRNMTQAELEILLKSKSTDNKCLEEIDKDWVKSVVLVANYWGQMASEYNQKLLDKKVAKEVLRLNYMKFCYVFENWLKSERRSSIYNNTINLFNEWKT